MDKEHIDYKKVTYEILITWLKKIDFLDDVSKRNWFEIGMLYMNKVKFLYYLYENAVTEKQDVIDPGKKFKYCYKNEKHCIQYNDDFMIYNQEEIIKILRGIINIVDDILPLGSVVELNKEFLQKHLGVDIKNEEIKVAITQRFIPCDNDKIYFEYAGVPYPSGVIDKSKVLIFTTRLIDKIVQKGYKDKQEEAFVCVMKNDLIVTRNKHSAGFVTKKELEAVDDKETN